MSASEQGALDLGKVSKGPNGRKGRPRGTGTLNLRGCSEGFRFFSKCGIHRTASSRGVASSDGPSWECCWLLAETRALGTGVGGSREMTWETVTVPWCLDQPTFVDKGNREWLQTLVLCRLLLYQNKRAATSQHLTSSENSLPLLHCTLLLQMHQS